MSISPINSFASHKQFPWDNEENVFEYELPAFENPFSIEKEVQVFETQIRSFENESIVGTQDEKVSYFAEEFFDGKKVCEGAKRKKSNENDNNRSFAKHKKMERSFKKERALSKDEVVEPSKEKNTESSWTQSEDNEFKKYLNKGRELISQKKISIKEWITQYESNTFPQRTVQSYLSRYRNLYLTANFNQLNIGNQDKSDMEVNDSSCWVRGNAPTEDSWTLDEEKQFINFLNCGREFVIAAKCYIKEWIGNYIPDKTFKNRTFGSYFAKYHMLKNQGRIVALNSTIDGLIADTKVLPWSDDENKMLTTLLRQYQKEEIEFDIILYKKIGIEMGRSYEMIQEQASKLSENNPKLHIHAKAIENKKSRFWSKPEEDEFCEHMEKGREAISKNKCSLKDWVDNYRSPGVRTQLALIEKYRNFEEIRKIEPLERNVGSFAKVIPWTSEEDLKLIEEIKETRSLYESRDNNITMTDLYKIIGVNIGRHHELIGKKYMALIKKTPDLKIAAVKKNGLTDDEKKVLNRILEEVKQENDKLNQLSTAKKMLEKWEVLENKTRDISVEQIRGFLRSNKN